MKTVVLAAVVVFMCALFGVAITLFMAPAETSVDAGWKLAWAGLGGGALAGVTGVWLVNVARSDAGARLPVERLAAVS
ncbi:MAG: hypothetical protein H0W40_07825 [Methylibium sp.]|uniref:hypothetical protein n=1 Tax=Methylibium sp. TaxID=2067992 RepID=UPI00180158B2|nr:hypothetical protein [Methylibium sp.]MBA3597270.1 hypothetical protein [Methylibium sp.]